MFVIDMFEFFVYEKFNSSNFAGDFGHRHKAPTCYSKLGLGTRTFRAFNAFCGCTIEASR